MESKDTIIELRGISKVFEDDGFKAVDNFNLEVKRGEFVTFLGPSGCGKTTTLRMIAGFDVPTEGDILLNGKSIIGLPPYERPINTVFQRYALFPHMNVYDNIAFGLGKTAEDDILNKGVWSESARKVLMAFLENYKTAYALKRLDYINTIFDDDAVIIVANVAKRAKGIIGDGKSYQDDKIIKYNRYSKDQYLKNLSRCFGANEFINIRFANNDVVKLGKGGETYGIQIAQDYYSSTYGDKGYLFLEVDVNNPKQPIIKVRTWQPEKDPNFGLYGPGDFK